MTSKVCLSCGEAKPLSEFYRDLRKEGSYRARCKPCRKDQRKFYYDDNRPSVLSAQSNYYTNNPEKYKSIRRKHHISNLQPICAFCNNKKGAKETDYRRTPE